MPASLCSASVHLILKSLQVIRFFSSFLDADNSGLHLSGVAMSRHLSECLCSCVQQSRQRTDFKEMALCYYKTLRSALLLMVLTLVRLCSELYYIRHGRTCDDSGHHHMLMAMGCSL